MNKISVIIPYYENLPSKKKVLKRCTDSLIGHNELIIVWNDRMGYSPAINRGLEIARGDFLIILNDDVIQEDRNLADFCNDQAITAPIFNGEKRKFHGSAFCMPRWAYEKVGPMWEGYDTSYFDDDDYLNKILLAGIPLQNAPIKFSHPVGGTTLEALPDRDRFFQENKNKFIARWGDTPENSRICFVEHGKFPRVPKD